MSLVFLWDGVDGEVDFIFIRLLISSASGTERGEAFYGPTDWLGSRDPMIHIRYTHGSLFGLDD
jgi:hypothetical protein